MAEDDFRSYHGIEVVVRKRGHEAGFYGFQILQSWTVFDGFLVHRDEQRVIRP